MFTTMSEGSTKASRESTSSPADSPAKISATQGRDEDWTEIGPDSGSSSHVPFAYFDPDSSSWRTCQGSLLEDSGESCTTWPKRGTWDSGFAYEAPISAPLIDGSESSSLLPTPSAYESTPGDEFIEEVRENLDDPHKRLYLPGRKWHAQRTLSRMAPALLPTPTTDDANNTTRASGDFQSLARTAHLLPTPNRSDSFGMEDSETLARGVRPSGQPVQVGLRNVKDLLRTPVANPDNPGAGGELRAQLTHGPTRRNETGVDTMGRPNAGRPSRLLPTPTQQDAKQNAENEAEAARNPNTMWATMARVRSGDHTNPQSRDGSPSSDDELPLQLTLGDDSSHDSSNG